MAPVVESSTPAFIQTNGAALTVTKPTGTVDGDFLLAIHMSDTDATLANVTAPAGWTTNGAGSRITNACNMKVSWKFASGEGASWSFPGASGGYRFVMVLRISGVHPTTPFSANPVYSTATGTSTTHTAPTITPSVADSLHIIASGKFDVTGRGDYSTTMPGGYTQRAKIGSSQSVAASATLATTAATGTKSFTNSDARNYLAVSFALAPGPSPASSTGNMLPFFG